MNRTHLTGETCQMGPYLKMTLVTLATLICLMPSRISASSMKKVSALASKCNSGKESACSELEKIALEDKDPGVRSAAHALLRCSEAECGPFPTDYEAIVRDWERSSGWCQGIPIVSIGAPVRGLKEVPGWKTEVVKRGSSTYFGSGSKNTLSGTFSKELTIYNGKVIKTD
ncbi:MAG: hypothetical protein WCC87_18205 [Candidatus Korobacteraceae bacterium]